MPANDFGVGITCLVDGCSITITPSYSFWRYLQDALSSEFYEDDDAQDLAQAKMLQFYTQKLKEVSDGVIDYDTFISDIQESGYPFDAYVENTLQSQFENIQYGGFLSRIGAIFETGDAQRIQEFFDKYENSGITSNSFILNAPSAAAFLTAPTIDDWARDAVKDAALGDGILGGTVDFEDLPGYGGLWDGIIRHIKVIGKGINLPIPEWLPLPGIFELPTIGDIFDTITGPWKDAAEDILKNCMDPNGDGVQDKSASDCLEEQSVIDVITGGIGNATTDIYNKTGTAISDAIKDVKDCAENPVECAQDVFDQIKDIFGEGAVDPTQSGGLPDWVKAIIIGGSYGDDVLKEIEKIFDADIDDDGTIGLGPEETFDCASIGKFSPDGGATSEADCIDACEHDSNIPSTSPECKDPAPDGYCEDGTTPKDNPAGTNCEEYEPPLPPEEQLCDEQGRVYNEITEECEETCVNLDHVVGPDGYCGPPEEQPCNNGAVDPGTCRECADGSTPDQHQGGNCENPLIDPNDPDNCAAGRPEGYSFDTQTWDRQCSADWCPEGVPKETINGVYGANCADYRPPEECTNGAENYPNCDQCPQGQSLVNGQCVGQPEECTNGATNYPDCDQCPQGQSLVNGECVGQPEECTNGATNYPNCDECPQGQSLVNGECSQNTFECDQQDRVTNDDGSCGECKPGFIENPDGFDQCIQAPPECNDCSCEEYAAAYPEECTTCPEGQEYCEATGSCATAEECEAATTDGTDDSSGGGGGGFGGGGGLFDISPLGISADPQLLSKSEFPITDFLAGIFTGSRGGRS